MAKITPIHSRVRNCEGEREKINTETKERGEREKMKMIMIAAVTLKLSPQKKKKEITGNVGGERKRRIKTIEMKMEPKEIKMTLEMRKGK
jgi:hypothetical protein